MRRTREFDRLARDPALAVTWFAAPMIILLASSAVPVQASASFLPARPTPTRSPSAAARLPASGPGLSINVNDGRKAAQPGDQLTYRVEVHNIGTTAAPRLKITQTLPAGLKFISASPHGVVAAGQVAWHVGLPAGRTGTFSVTGQVGKTPKAVLRLATVACATAAGSSRPIVCAAHSDELPAGAAAGRQAATSTRPSGLRYGLAGALILLLGITGALAGRRFAARRRTAHSR